MRIVIGANTAAPVITFLAAASLGAIFTSLAADMGEKVGFRYKLYPSRTNV